MTFTHRFVAHLAPDKLGARELFPSLAEFTVWSGCPGRNARQGWGGWGPGEPGQAGRGTGMGVTPSVFLPKLTIPWFGEQGRGCLRANPERLRPSRWSPRRALSSTKQSGTLSAGPDSNSGRCYGHMGLCCRVFFVFSCQSLQKRGPFLLSARCTRDAEPAVSPRGSWSPPLGDA